MPLRPSYTGLQAASRHVVFDKRIICPSCQFASLLGPLRASRSVATRSPQAQRRKASTLTSSTAVNAARDIPAELQDLHSSIARLSKEAPNYVNISRLQLALRSLESTEPVLRIAVLGLQSNSAARRLARLLVADVLSPEGAWEQQLANAGDEDTRSFILRYGNEQDLPPPDSLVSTIHIPSPILKKCNLEILISSLNLTASSVESLHTGQQLESTALVPLAETPKSFSGQVSFVRYPVHRALVVAEGVDGALTLGRFSATEDENKSKSMRIALHLPAATEDTSLLPLTSSLAILDIGKAAQGLDLFRESNANGIAYERAWYASGLPTLTQWAFPRSTEQSVVTRAIVLQYVSSVLEETNQAILQEDSEHQRQLADQQVPSSTRQPLIKALSAWATASHTELQANLEKAFVSEPWRKLAWWKLFWRVDDVGMLLNELVERAWLVEAEKGAIFLAGRGAEAGIYHEEPSGTVADDLLPGEKQAIVDPIKTTSIDLEETRAVALAAEASKPGATTPWPRTIPLARQHLNLTSIPPLQSLAQTLVLQTLSLTSSATALSALLYISMAGVSVAEAAAVGALGLVYSLRRMQRRWERARAEWQATLRERGRVVLRGTEDSMRTALNGRPSTQTSNSIEDVGVQDRAAARAAVERARAALVAVKGDSQASE